MSGDDFARIEALLAQRIDHERKPPVGGFSLDRVRAAAARLDEPGHAFPVVHVAGTCGKGSVCALVAAAIDLAGERVGLTTSPHLVHMRERVRVGPLPASASAWEQALELVFAAEDPRDPLTWFELVILTALSLFKAEGVERAVVEVGLGGRLDATQVVRPAVSVITRISLDHTQLLGADTAAIAREKAGILRPGVPLIAGPEDEAARRAIAERAAELGCDTWWLGEDLAALPQGDEIEVRVPGASLRCPRRDHAAWPQALALAAGALARLDLELLDHLPAAAAQLRWRGRGEVLPRAPGRPRMILDGAHDPAALAALAASLATRAEAGLLLLVAAAEDKERGVVRALAPHLGAVVATEVHPLRALPADRLTAEAAELGLPAEAHPALNSALARACEWALAEERAILVTGSLHLVGGVLESLGQEADAAWIAAPRGGGGASRIGE